MTISRKIYLAPINTGFFSEGDFQEEMYRFHAARSGNGIAVAYVGNVAVREVLTTNSRTAYFTPQNGKSFRRLSSIIQYAGSLAGIQIAARSDFDPAVRKWKGSSIRDYISHTQNNLTIRAAEIESIQNDFIECAARSIEAGFDVIQIHAAHGYLLSNWLSPTLNPMFNDTEIGGIKVLENIVRGIRNFEKGIKIDIRFSITDPVDSDKTTIIRELLNLDIDILSFSAGIYDIDKSQIYPGSHAGQLPYYDLAKQFFNSGPEINLAGNISRIDLLDNSYNVSYSIGRNLIANPRFVIDNSTHCNYRNKCHYYSRSRDHIECPISRDLS